MSVVSPKQAILAALPELDADALRHMLTEVSSCYSVSFFGCKSSERATWKTDLFDELKFYLLTPSQLQVLPAAVEATADYLTVHGMMGKSKLARSYSTGALSVSFAICVCA